MTVKETKSKSAKVIHLNHEKIKVPFLLNYFFQFVNNSLDFLILEIRNMLLRNFSYKALLVVVFLSRSFPTTQRFALLIFTPIAIGYFLKSAAHFDNYFSSIFFARY